MPDEAPPEEEELKPNTKSPTMLVEARVDWVSELVLMGCQFRQINESIREEEANPDSILWFSNGHKPLTRRAIVAYIARANDQIAATIDRNREKAVQRHIARPEWLYLKTISVGSVPDYRAALSILQDLGKIERIYPVEETKLTGTLKVDHELTDQQANELLTQLLAENCPKGAAPQS